MAELEKRLEEGEQAVSTQTQQKSASLLMLTSLMA